MNDNTRKFGDNTRFGSAYSYNTPTTQPAPVTPSTPSVTPKSELKDETRKFGENERFGGAYTTNVQTHPNTNYSFNGSYDDGVRLGSTDANARYGSYAQEDKNQDGFAYDAFKYPQTFPNMNYSFVTNAK